MASISLLSCRQLKQQSTALTFAERARHKPSWVSEHWGSSLNNAISSAFLEDQGEEDAEKGADEEGEDHAGKTEEDDEKRKFKGGRTVLITKDIKCHHALCRDRIRDESMCCLRYPTHNEDNEDDGVENDEWYGDGVHTESDDSDEDEDEEERGRASTRRGSRVQFVQPAGDMGVSPYWKAAVCNWAGIVAVDDLE